MTKHLSFCSTLALASAVGFASLAAEPLRASGAAVRFTARGVAGLKITGETTKLTLKEADDKLSFSSPTTDFKTGIGLRDRHLKEHLEADKYPEATLVVERKKLAMPSGGKGASATLPSDFTLHGATHPVKLRYTIEPAGSGYKVHGAFDVNLADFGIKQPCYMGICVGETVGVEVDFSATGG